MLIRVMRNEGSYDYVKPQLLDRLIQSEEIVSFYRESGAVFFWDQTLFEHLRERLMLGLSVELQLEQLPTGNVFLITKVLLFRETLLICHDCQEAFCVTGMQEL